MKSKLYQSCSLFKPVSCLPQEISRAGGLSTTWIVSTKVAMKNGVDQGVTQIDLVARVQGVAADKYVLLITLLTSLR